MLVITIVILICEILAIIGVIYYFKKNSFIQWFYKNRIKDCKAELTVQIKEFIEIFDKFEMYFDKNMEEEEFFTILKAKGLLDEDSLWIPLDSYDFKMQVRNTWDLRRILYLCGDLIYERADLANQLYGLRFDQVEDYDVFSIKFEKLNLICSKHARKEKEIIISEDYDIIVPI